MSNQFLGLTMLVTLSSPVGAQLRGEVSSVEPGKSLTLRNVICPANGKQVPEFTIDAGEIVELVEAPNENDRLPRMPTPPQSKKFEDPAILSMGRRSASTLVDDQSAYQGHQFKAMPVPRADSSQTIRGDRALKDVTPVSSLVEPMRNLQSTLPQMGDTDTVILSELEAKPEASPVQTTATTKKRRSRRKGQTRKNGEDIPDAEVIPAKETVKSKGWRQTPLLEPNPSFQPFSTLRKKRLRPVGRFEDNGWATEEATDVQEMGDFDFQESLAKFDKHTIFHQMQAEDSIAAEDRLVAHNRLPKAKPGTAGGKNLHYTENVLDAPSGGPQSKTENWRSEAGDSGPEDRASQRDTGTAGGRRFRKAERVDGRLSTMKRSASRKGSGTASQPPHTHAMPIPSKASFYLVPSDRRCEPISALQMLNLENIADHDLGLTEDMMTENAGRGIAEVGLSALNTTIGRLTHNTASSLSNVAVFAGNNKSGLRAVAAGRHLRNHGVNVVVCVLGIEHESELLAGLRRQLKVFRGFGGKVLARSDFLEHLKSLEGDVSLILDGLLGLTFSFEELRLGDQATAYELIDFANRNSAPVLAVDIPTGIDPTTGKVSIIDGRQLYLHAKYIVAMGAPKKGLLEAMALGEGVADDEDLTKGKEWQLFVADLGLGTAVWKKAGTRVRRGVDFDGSWVLGMRFQAGVL